MSPATFCATGAHKIGFGTGEMAFATRDYELKEGAETSHQQIVHWLERRTPGRILDLGCADGRLGERLRMRGHDVTGVDVSKAEGVGERLNAFVEANLDEGIPPMSAATTTLSWRPTCSNTSGGRSACWNKRNRRCSRAAPSSRAFRTSATGIRGTRRARAFRLRPARHPRRRSRPVLHPPELRTAGEDVGVLGAAPREHRLAGRSVQPWFRIGECAPILDERVATIEHVAVETWPTLFGFQFLYELELSRAD